MTRRMKITCADLAPVEFYEARTRQAYEVSRDAASAGIFCRFVYRLNLDPSTDPLLRFDFEA